MPHSVLVNALVFATGMAGLIYQVAWQRYLGRLLGSDTTATAVILAVFLGGLAVGYALFGVFSARVRNALKTYGLLEAGIGLWGLAFPLVFQAVSDLSAAWRFQPMPLLVVQGVLCTLLLVGLPTMLMGSTVPVLTRALSTSLAASTSVHARVYAVNTAGAFVGALLAGFLLVPRLGLPDTVRLAAALNLAAAAAFLAMARKVPPAPASEPPRTGAEPPAPSVHSPKALLAIAFLGGYATMALENVLIRVVNLSLGSSSYSFSLIVAAFILAIALGSALVSRARRLTPATILHAQILTAALLLLVYLSLDTWPYFAHLLRITLPRSPAGFWIFQVCVMVALTLVLAAPVGLLGAVIPLLFHEYKRSLADVGSHSGRLLAVNTAGNLAGSLVGGILLYLVAGIPEIFLSSVAAVTLGAVAASRPLNRRKQAAAALAALLALAMASMAPAFDQSRFMIGAFRIHESLPFSHSGPSAFFAGLHEGNELLFHEDGPAGTVSVVAVQGWDPADGPREMALMVNGKSDSAVVGDAQTLRLIAHVPALLAERRERVMVVGLGTGVTAGEFSLYPDLKRLDVAEISSTVVRALPLFTQAAHAVHEDPRLVMHVGDALRILGRSREQWDIIVSEPSNPWVTGVDLLFTREFYALVRERLAQGGLFLQWMHINGASPAMFGMVHGTLREVFPAVRVFISQANDLLMLASETPLGEERLGLAESTLAGNPAVKASLAEIGIPSLAALLLREVWATGVPPPLAGEPLQTMDHPRLHYMAGKSIFQGHELAPATLLVGSGDWPEVFLLPKLPGWPAFPGLPPDARELMNSAVDGSRANEPLPTGLALRLRAHLADPGSHGLNRAELNALRPELVRLAMSPHAGEQDLAAAGLSRLPWPERIELVRQAVARTRCWVTPYPLDGLRAMEARAAGG